MPKYFAVTMTFNCERSDKETNDTDVIVSTLKTVIKADCAFDVAGTAFDLFLKELIPESVHVVNVERILIEEAE